MATNFFVILGNLDERSARRVQVSKSIQDTLSTELEQQAKDFLSYTEHISGKDGERATTTIDAEAIDFFPIYSLPDNKQIFKIDNFAIDDFVLSAAKNPDSLQPLKLTDDIIPQIKAFCGASGTKAKPKIYFQSFDRRRILRKDRFTFLQSGNTFSRLDQVGFTLGDSLQAIYDGGALYFRSFSVVSRFLGLLGLFNEASNEKVEEVLGSSLFHVSDAEKVTQFADTHMRKQFAAISELGVLDKATPKAVADAAKEFDVSVTVSKHDGKLQIDFPDEKRDQKQLLSLLTEGYYKGPLTGNKYQSNSHRPLEAKASAGKPARKVAKKKK